MKEDLNLYGNQYNYIVVAWTVGYIIGQWPSNFILTRVRAHSKSHTCIAIESLALTHQSQSGSLSLRLDGQSLPLLSLERRRITKCWLFDLWSVFSKLGIGLLCIIFLGLGIIKVSLLLNQLLDFRSYRNRRTRQTKWYPPISSVHCANLQWIPTGWYLLFAEWPCWPRWVEMVVWYASCN
jgi:hypothetical protein